MHHFCPLGWLALAAVACLGLVLPWHVTAQAETAAESPVIEEVSVGLIQDRLAQIENSTTLDETAKAQARELYQQALTDLDAAANWESTAKRFEQRIAEAPDELTRIKAELQGPPQEQAFAIPKDGLLQLEQTLSQKQGDLERKRAEAAELENEPQRRASRRVEIPKLTAGLRERITEIDAQLQTSTAADEPAEMIAARRLRLLARRRASEQELRSYQQEIRAYEVRAELLPLRRDFVTREVAQMQQEVEAWQNAVKQQRQREVEAQLRDAQRQTRLAHPAIAKLTEENAELTERRKALAQVIVQTTTQLDNTTEKLSSLQEQFTRIQGKVETVGLTNAIGHLLRRQREAMPDLRSHRRNIKNRQVEIGQRQFELLQLEDRRADLANLDAQIQKELQTAGHVSVGAEASLDAPSELETAARGALETEKEYLGALINDLNSYSDKLVDLDSAERQLIKLVQEYSKYIDERVLWIRSAPSLDLATIGQTTEASAWLLEPKAWLDLIRGLLTDATDSPLLAAMAIIVFTPLLWIQRRLRKSISEIGETAGRANCCSVIPTLEAIVLTLSIASVVPGILWYVSWRLGAAGGSSEFAKAVAAALAEMAGVYLLLDLLLQTCRVDGLAENHFDWPVSAMKPLRQYVRGAKLLILPLVFISAAMRGQDNERWADSLGRLAFVAVMVVSALLVLRSLRATGGIFQAVFSRRRGGWIDRLRCIWYPAAVLVPVTLAVLASLGYFFTAEELAQRILASAYVFLGLTLVGSLLQRWVLVKRRKLAIEQLRQRRAANQAALQADAKSTSDPDAPLPIPTPVERDLDLATINAQTRRLVEHCLVVAGLLGIGLVWADVLPALRILDGISLWQMAGQAEAVSLADLGLAMLLGAITIAAARNIPGLLEMAVLQHLPFDTGLRYTIRAVSRYLIVVVGLVAACNVIGLGWAKVQWLVAAVSVGLGFGLQEIFANFISGLIILFEQPVRIGDVVTVDDVTGVISRIRMRATTITNWDRKEFIVPNKEFITGRVLNWTLTDQINRVVLTVGIAYGSDTDLAAELLMGVAEEHPIVLGDPAPRVTFEEFGDSALNFVLRCYLPDLENRLQVIHDLHSTVDRRFREAGIEIAFPQQDIHIRSVHANQSLFERTLAGENRVEDRKVA